MVFAEIGEAGAVSPAVALNHLDLPDIGLEHLSVGCSALRFLPRCCILLHVLGWVMTTVRWHVYGLEVRHGEVW